MSHKTTRLKRIINYQKKKTVSGKRPTLKRSQIKKFSGVRPAQKYFYRRFSTPELCQNLKYLVKIVNTSQLLTDLKGWQQRKIIFNLVVHNKGKPIQNNPKIILKSKRNISESLFFLHKSFLKSFWYLKSNYKSWSNDWIYKNLIFETQL